MNEAARRLRCTVAEYLAAPLQLQPHFALSCVQCAVEFFVPPESAESFAFELDRQICRRSAGYSRGRQCGSFAALVIHRVPSGVFHQWRKSWHTTGAVTASMRWSADRTLMASILWQVRMGWSDGWT